MASATVLMDYNKPTSNTSENCFKMFFLSLVNTFQVLKWFCFLLGFLESSLFKRTILTFGRAIVTLAIESRKNTLSVEWNLFSNYISTVVPGKAKIELEYSSLLVSCSKDKELAQSCDYIRKFCKSGEQRGC